MIQSYTKPDRNINLTIFLTANLESFNNKILSNRIVSLLQPRDSVSRAGSRPGDPEAGPRRFGVGAGLG